MDNNENVIIDSDECFSSLTPHFSNNDASVLVKQDSADMYKNCIVCGKKLIKTNHSGFCRGCRQTSLEFKCYQKGLTVDDIKEDQVCKVCGEPISMWSKTGYCSTCYRKSPEVRSKQRERYRNNPSAYKDVLEKQGVECKACGKKIIKNSKWGYCRPCMEESKEYKDSVLNRNSANAKCACGCGNHIKKGNSTGYRRECYVRTEEYIASRRADHSKDYPCKGGCGKILPARNKKGYCVTCRRKSEEYKEYLREYIRSEKYKKYKSEWSKKPENALRNALAGNLKGHLKLRDLSKRRVSTFTLTGYDYSEYEDELSRTLDIPIIEALDAGYHIDHIIPVSLAKGDFDKIIMLFQPRNLRLIPGEENMSKKAKIDFELINKHNLMDLYEAIIS